MMTNKETAERRRLLKRAKRRSIKHLERKLTSREIASLRHIAWWLSQPVPPLMQGDLSL